MQKASGPGHRKAFRNNYLAVIGATALILLSSVSQAQKLQSIGSYGFEYKRGQYDTVLAGPTGCGTPGANPWLLNVNPNKNFLLYFDSCGHKLWVFDPSSASWSGFTGSSFDTTSISARINAKLNWSDTTNMLLAYTRIGTVVSNLGGCPGIREDVAANRPVAGTAGILFLAVDTKLLYRDNGFSWDLIGSGGGGGSADSTIMQTIYRSDTAKQAIRNSISLKADTTGGVIRRSDTANKYVNRLTNNATNDSIIYYIGSTRYAIKDNGGASGSDSGIAVTNGILATRSGSAPQRLLQVDSSKYATRARLQKIADSLASLADSLPINNLLTSVGGIGQLGGTSVKGNTSLGFHDTDTLSLDSLKYLKMPHLQLLTASDQTYIVVRDTISGIFYNIPASRSDTTGVAAIKAAGGIPFAYYDSATNKIKFQALPQGPWVKVGNITSTQTATDTVIVGTILYPKGKFNAPGIQNDGGLTGKNTVTFAADSSQTDSLVATATAPGSFFHKHLVTTINGSSAAFGFGAHMHKWDWTNANISQNVSNYINEFTYRENAANGSTRDFIPNVLYAPSVGSGDSLRSAYAFICQTSSPVGILSAFGLGHLVGTGNNPNVLAAYGILDDNFTVGGPHETVHSNLAWGVNNAFLRGAGGARSYVNWISADTVKKTRLVKSTATPWLVGIRKSDSIDVTLTLNPANFSTSNDTVSVIGGAGGINTVKKIITQASHPFTANEPIYLDTTSTTWHAADTTNFAMAVVDSVIDANTFEATFAGTYNNIHGLSTGKYYYVTMPAGSTSSISPTKSQPVFIPINTTTILVNIQRPVDFSGAVSGGGTGAVASVNGQTGVVVTKSADSLKKLPIDTSASPRNGYVLTFDSTNHKWYLTAPSTGGGGSTPTWQQIFNTQVGGALPTKPDTVLLTNGNYLRLKGGQVFLDTGTVGNGTHTASQKWQVSGGTYSDFINTDLNTAAGSAGTAEFKQLNLNSPSTQAFKLEFQNGGVNTFNAKMTGNGNNTLGTQYFYLGANSSQIATPVSAYTGGSIQFDTRLLPVMKFFAKYAGATQDSLAMAIDTNAVVIIGSQVQAVGSGLLQSASKTKPQFGVLYDATHSALFRVNSAGALGISSLKGLAISSSALPTGGSSDSVLVISGDSVKKILQSSIGGGSAANKFSQTANGTAVTNTTSLTSIIGTGTGSQVIAANSLSVGQVITVHGWVQLSTSTGSPTLVIYTAPNSTTGASVGSTMNLTASMTNQIAELRMNCTVISLGTGGTGTGQISAWGTLKLWGTTQEYVQVTGPVNINTTIANTFDVLAGWGAASASNSINSFPQFTIEVK